MTEPQIAAVPANPLFGNAKALPTSEPHPIAGG